MFETVNLLWYPFDGTHTYPEVIKKRHLRMIRHELGHAWGFLHEHQYASIEEEKCLYKDIVMTRMQRREDERLRQEGVPPYRDMTDQQIEEEIRLFLKPKFELSEQDLDRGPFDRTSIMAHPSGGGVIPINYLISLEYQSFAMKTYPFTAEYHQPSLNHEGNLYTHRN